MARFISALIILGTILGLTGMASAQDANPAVDALCADVGPFTLGMSEKAAMKVIAANKWRHQDLGEYLGIHSVKIYTSSKRVHTWELRFAAGKLISFTYLALLKPWKYNEWLDRLDVLGTPPLDHTGEKVTAIISQETFLAGLGCSLNQ